MTNLSDEGKDPDGVIDWVGEQPNEDVSLSVDLPRVDLVENRHHNEGVEHHREVDRRRCRDARPFAVVNVEKNVSCKIYTDSLTKNY